MIDHEDKIDKAYNEGYEAGFVAGYKSGREAGKEEPHYCDCYPDPKKPWFGLDDD